MKSIRILLTAVGLLYGASDFAAAAEVNFKVTDIPGHFFDLDGMANPFKATRSLAIVPPGTKVNFWQDINGVKVAESKHTVTSLIWPSTAAPGERIDQVSSNQDNHDVTLTTPGLYVYLCKLHPYMLGAVIVDNPATTTVNAQGKRYRHTISATSSRCWSNAK